MTMRLLPLRRWAGRAALLSAALLAAGCDDQLLPGIDETPPTFTVETPSLGARFAQGDSVRVRVHVRDDEAIARVAVSIVAVAAGADPRAAERTEVYTAREVVVDEDMVRERTVEVTLGPKAEPAPGADTYLQVQATDRRGHTRTEWLQVVIGGSSVQIVTPANNTQVRAGTAVPVRITAADTARRISALILRSTGALEGSQVVQLPLLPAMVDTTLSLTLPAGTPADSIMLTASAISAAGDTATSARTVLHVVAASADTEAPRVTFSHSITPRSDLTDTLTVLVSATDNTQVDSVGATLFVIYHRGGTTADTVASRTLRAAGSSHVFEVPVETLNPLRIPNLLLGQDSLTLSYEVTAFAVDSAGVRNCGAAVSPGTPQSLPCRAGPAGTRVTDLPGGRRESMLTRGITVRLGAGNRIADVVADSAYGRVFASNQARNRLEVLSVGARTFSAPVAVGSEPWGLALGVSRDTLFVANSGGTNISVVSLVGPAPREAYRIFTSDARLYDVTYDVEKDSVSDVVEIDYSDRPQYIAQVSTGQLLYSTRPTAAAADGTVRIWDPTKDRTYVMNRGSEIFTGYAERTIGKAIVVNALNAGYTVDKRIGVQPRRLRQDQPDPAQIVGSMTEVRDSLAILRAAGLTDTRLDLSSDATSVGLRDTTFVAVSRDYSTVAFGEGATALGRIMRFQVTGAGLLGSTEETRDLIGNASDRVVGLALNRDGSLGAARGQQVYFFDSRLRLQGVTASDQPAGGVGLHPAQFGYPETLGSARMSFVSGVSAGGVPYIDVIDAYTFCLARRIFMRDAVIGALAVMPRRAQDPSDVALRLYAVTAAGIVEMVIAPGDLQQGCR